MRVGPKGVNIATSRLSPAAVGRGFHLSMAWLVTFLFILPVYIAFSNTFKTQAQILDGPLELPAPFTTDNVTDAWNRSDRLVQDGLINSVLITVITVSIIIPLASAVSLYLHQSRPALRRILTAILALGLMVPPQVSLQPIVLLLQEIHLNNSRTGLILANIGGGYLSFATFVYMGFISSIPRDILDAARVDGASDLRIWWKILLPLLRPATATVAIFVGLWSWNDFLNPLFIIGPLDGVTITTGIYITLGGFSVDFAHLFGVMFIAAVIPIIGYLATQREFISGLMKGATE